MKKLLLWFNDNILGLATLFLLAFIPLYPKLPLLDVRHTWVYVRVEDFAVLFVLLVWGWQVARRKITLQTPLTIPLLVFWIIGAIGTIHGILLIFSTLMDAYPNVAFLSFLRRIEYMSLFFVSYSALKDKKFLLRVVVVLTATLLAVSIYGLGQKYFTFPAFLTMNEEFAKGIPIQLSPLSRISSTFSGHYDLAAYLVLILPIVVSMSFAFRHRLVRMVLLGTSLLGAVVLFMTVSRISFFALLLSVGFVLLFQKRKLVFLAIPIVAIAAVFFVAFAPRVFDRLGSTVKEIDVLVEAKTGEVIGHPKVVPNDYFANKIVKQQYAPTITKLNAYVTSSADIKIVSREMLDAKEVLLVEPSVPTGEDLPSGTGYINLSLSPVVKRLTKFLYEPKQKASTTSAEVFFINGNFLLKKVFTYDLSFTTRFQGAWPRAISSFKKNIFIGSGYGSVGLAVDNSYLRMLGEIGILGFASFFAIFIVMAVYIRKALPSVDSPIEKSFIVGFVAGFIGLAVNAVFIDVFEASKIAFLMWLLVGLVFGLLRLNLRTKIHVFEEVIRVMTSPLAVIIYLFVTTIVFYSSITRNYFVGDDFTWFRWAAESGQSAWSTIIGYFTHADGFFYRPGAKIYFLLMYHFFWFNQTVYHFVSILLHFFVAALVFLLARKILKVHLLAAAAGFLFLLLSGYSEAVHWISATGFLFTACFSLLSLLSFIAWEEKKKTIYFIGTFGFLVLSLLFHESGLVTPLFYLLYLAFSERMIRLSKFLLLPVPFYLLVRYMAQSHWFSGDYSYNILKLPFNALGNALGYFSLLLFGSFSSPFYLALRNALRGNMVIAAAVGAILLVGVVLVCRKFLRHATKEKGKPYIFALVFFLIALLPFLGLGNISPRYSYLASVGVVFLVVLFLKKFYVFLLSSSQVIALGAVTLVVSIFCLFQLIQLQQVHGDWYDGGEKARRFLVAMEGAYRDEWAKEDIELHLVNVPIRSGEAWIFPVGITDALWLLFRNPSMKVFTWPTATAALDAVSFTSQSKRIFEFDQEGKIVERTKVPPAK